VLVTETKGVLGLVHDALASASVHILVLGAAKLVRYLLARRLLGVGNGSAGNLITGAGEGLLHLLGGGLGGVGGHALLSLG